ncbi:MAG: hemerythrin domain-containing protein [Pseudonocardia sp.]|nr:hemerythrin domain-containing protein [Pseudonocardia sp.]
MSTTSTDAPDLLGITLAHRMMRTDLHRLTDVAERIASGACGCTDRRAAAIAAWIGTLCDEIHHHHTSEDEIAWPVITRYASGCVDLAVLTDDHHALDPLLDEVRSAVQRLTSARTGARGPAAGELAARLARVRDEIDEHLDAEESGLFPVIERYVPAAEWKRIEEEVRRNGPGAQFVLPRMADVASPAEWAHMRAVAGPVPAVLARLMRPGHRHRERLVFA